VSETSTKQTPTPKAAPSAPPLAGLFAGDWLAFLEYLGEQPNPGEEIASTLPAPKLYATGADLLEDDDAGVRKVALHSIAAPTGVRPDPSLRDELERMAAGDPEQVVQDAARDVLARDP
jgi:hypothetical protein